MKKNIYVSFGLILLINALIAAAGPGKTWLRTFFFECPRAAFTAGDTCAGKPLLFVNTTTGAPEGTTYSWDFGDGTGSQEFSPIHTYSVPDTYLVRLTVTFTGVVDDVGQECVSVWRELVVIKPSCFECPSNLKISFTEGCTGDPIFFSFTATGEVPATSTFLWTFGDGQSSTQKNPAHVYASPGSYSISLTVSSTNIIGNDTITCTAFTRLGGEVGGIFVDNCPPLTQNCCEGSFAPIRGKKYVLSAWVKEKNGNTFSYENPAIFLSFKNAPLLGPYIPKGDIIDGWQRIEEEFVVPPFALTIRVDLRNNGPNDVFFDDIRIQPFDGNMKSFVYDPATLRLVAELDENNYATVYEYNDEGNLIRTKKETERGIMTVNEFRNGTKKNP